MQSQKEAELHRLKDALEKRVVELQMKVDESNGERAQMSKDQERVIKEWEGKIRA